MKKILDRDAENHKRIKMLISYSDDRVEELIAHNKLCNLVAEQHDKEASGDDAMFTFCCVVDHKGPSKPGDSECMGLAATSRLNGKMRELLPGSL